MTAFMHGKARAHVMKFDRVEMKWKSICPHFKQTLRPGDPQYHEPGSDWPLRHVHSPTTPRLVPWCDWCVTVARRRVSQLLTDVISPSVRENETERTTA